MEDLKEKISYDNRGSALITALVVSAVIMVLSLSLLAVSYSFFLSQKKNNGDASEREMLYSAIEVFEQELFEGGHKAWEDGVNDKTKAANPDDNLFGTKIVASIFKYHENPGIQESESGEIPSVDRAWPCYDSNSANSVESVNSKVFRYFKITSISAYEITAQMYWEYENNDHIIDDIVLHAIYRLKKNNETLMKNERFYRLGSSKKAARLVEDDVSGEENGNTEGEGTTEPKDYIIYFGPKPKTPEYKFRVSPEFFPGMSVATNGERLPFIRITSTEKQQDSFFEKNEYANFASFFYSWYTGSGNTANSWNGTYQQLFDDYNSNIGKDRTARYQWDDAVPVRIRFVINGQYLDIDRYAYYYLRYLEGKSGSQVFTEKDLYEIVSNELLEACDINTSGMDNRDSIKWMYEFKGNYFDFFDDKGDPFIKPEHLTSDNYSKLEYTVYATFPSFYEFGKDYKKLILPYDKNRTISLDNLCTYTKYSFERIIG